MFLLPLNETQEEFIKKEEFYQPDDKIDEDVTQLIEWLTKQPHLPNITDRKWLTNFIKSCKYNLQRSKNVIESYCIVRAKYPKFFGSFTREDLINFNEYGSIYLLPKRMPNGDRITLLVTCPSTNDETFDITITIKLALAILDLQLKTEPLYGNIIVYDMKYYSLRRFLNLTPTLVKATVKCFLNAFPERQKATHIINPPTFINRFIMMIKMLVPNKFKERYIIHETLEEFYEHIPKDVLPDIYGGTGGNIEELQKDMFDFVLSNSKWLEERPKADLTKLPDNMEPDEMEGTFKKLQID